MITLQIRGSGSIIRTPCTSTPVPVPQHPVPKHPVPEESVVLHALLPEVFALVPLVEVELDDVLVVALQTTHVIIQNAEVGIYKRKQESKKTRKQEKKETRTRPRK